MSTPGENHVVKSHKKIKFTGIITVEIISTTHPSPSPRALVVENQVSSRPRDSRAWCARDNDYQTRTTNPDLRRKSAAAAYIGKVANLMLKPK